MASSVVAPTISESLFSRGIEQRFHALIAELVGGEVGYLTDIAAEDFHVVPLGPAELPFPIFHPSMVARCTFFITSSIRACRSSICTPNSVFVHLFVH